MKAITTNPITAAAIAFAWIVAPGTVRADENYYMVVFAYEGSPNTARAAHTFAAFLKVTYEKGSDPKLGHVERHTISWLPATLDVRLLHRPESGKNLGLRSTLQLGMSEGAAISAWGPYRIRKELYDRGIAQIQRLEKGEVAYKALDGAYRPDAATNCFHAISDIVPGPLLDTGLDYGRPASAMVVEHLSPWIIHPEKTSNWLIERMGLDKYTIAFGG